MEIFYLTFGQQHLHRINGTIWDKDLVCIIEAEGYDDARNIAFDYFGVEWAFIYSEDEIKKDFMDNFPRGAKKL